MRMPTTCMRMPATPMQRRSGVDVLLNAESVRETPAVVSFSDKQRFIGVHGAAKVRFAPPARCLCVWRGPHAVMVACTACEAPGRGGAALRTPVCACGRLRMNRPK